MFKGITKFIKSMVSLIIIIGALIFINSYTESITQYEVFIFYTIPFTAFIGFIVFICTVTIILDLLLSIFLPENFIEDAPNESSNSIAALKDKNYASLTLPKAPESDKDFIVIGTIISLFLFGIILVIMNIIRTSLEWLKIITEEFFRTQMNLWYILIIIITVFTQIPYYNLMIKKLKTRERAQQQELFDTWLDEKNKDYNIIEQAKSINQISNPNEYLLQMIRQYYKENYEISIKFVLVITLFFAVLLGIFFYYSGYSILFEIKLFTLAFIGFFLSMALFVKLINKINGTIPGDNKRMIEASLRNDLDRLIEEVQEYEQSDIKNKHPNQRKNSHNMTLFWYFRARLMMIAGKYEEAKIILEALYKKYSEKYILHGEVANLLAQCCRSLINQSEAEQYEIEYRKIFNDLTIKEGVQS